MNKINRLSLLFLTCFCFYSCTCGSGEKKPKGIKHVFVIGIDAMSSQGLEKASTPHMDYLIQNGAVCRSVRTVIPSSSSSNWASMLMGAGVEIHGVTTNNWRPDNHTLKPVVIGESGIFPTVVSVVKKQLPDQKIGMIYHWEGFGNLFEKNIADRDQFYKTQLETTEALADYIRKEKPTFTFTQLDDVDAEGHRHGHMTEGYLAGITEADRCVGIIYQAIKDAGIEDESLIMVVADHGGLGYGHGGHSWEEVTVPLILYGKNIKKGYEVGHQVYMFDVAPTVVYALGLDAPYVWTGRPVRAAFEGNKEPEDPVVIKKLSYGPLINGGKKLFEQAGGLFVDRQAEVVIEPYLAGEVIYYTLDGTEPTQQSERYQSPFRLDRTTVVKAKTFSPEGGESLTSEAYFRVMNSNPANGVHVAYYIGNGWKMLPIFKNEKIVEKWTSQEIRLDRDQLLPLLPKEHSNFGLVFDTCIEIDTDGLYTFYLQSDDGSKLYINDNKVVDNDGGHGLLEKEGEIELKKGRHKLKVEFFNDHGGYWVEAFYKGPGIPRQIIPADKLFKCNN